MTSYIVNVKSENYFGQIDNPLWQVATLKKDTDKSSLSPWSQVLVPLEDWKIKIDGKKNLHFQSFLSEENLKHYALLDKLNSQYRVQIWIDRIINPREASILKELLLKYENLDLVYLPDLHTHPMEIFKNLGVTPRLLVQMNLKKNSFDRWLSPFELWERICWLKEDLKIQTLGTQVLDTQLAECKNKTEELFMLNPCIENLENHLKFEDKTQYYVQSLTYSFSKLMKKEHFAMLRYAFWATMTPTRAKWIHLYNWFYSSLVKQHVEPLRWHHIKKFKTHAVFYPIRKVYWFCEHQFNKRILGNVNESSQRSDTSYKLRS